MTAIGVATADLSHTIEGIHPSMVGKAMGRAFEEAARTVPHLVPTRPGEEIELNVKIKRDTQTGQIVSVLLVAT